VNQKHLKIIVDMGFSEKVAIEALLKHKNQLLLAIDEVTEK
jgi:hypothetical protein